MVRVLKESVEDDVKLRRFNNAASSGGLLRDVEFSRVGGQNRAINEIDGILDYAIDNYGDDGKDWFINMFMWSLIGNLNNNMEYEFADKVSKHINNRLGLPKSTKYSDYSYVSNAVNSKETADTIINIRDNLLDITDRINDTIDIIQSNGEISKDEIIDIAKEIYNISESFRYLTNSFRVRAIR